MSSMKQKKIRQPIGRRPARSPWGFFFAVLTTLVCLGSLAVVKVWSHAVLLERMYAVSRAQAEHERLANELELLSLEEAALASTARVQRESQAALGLSPAPAERTVFVGAKAATGTSAQAAVGSVVTNAL